MKNVNLFAFWMCGFFQFFSNCSEDEGDTWTIVSSSMERIRESDFRTQATVFRPTCFTLFCSWIQCSIPLSLNILTCKVGGLCCPQWWWDCPQTETWMWGKLDVAVRMSCDTSKDLFVVWKSDLVCHDHNLWWEVGPCVKSSKVFPRLCWWGGRTNGQNTCSSF